LKGFAMLTIGIRPIVILSAFTLVLTATGTDADVPPTSGQPPAEIAAQSELKLLDVQIGSGTLAEQPLADAYARRCRIKFGLHAIQAAIDDCSKSISAFDNVAARVLRAEIYSVQKAYAAALDDGAAILRLQPSSPLGHAVRALVYWIEKDVDHYAVESDAEIAMAPDPIKLLKARGEEYFNSGYWARAKGDYDAILRRQPGNAETVRYRGDSRLFMGDFDGALQDYDLALKLDPKGQATAVPTSKILAYMSRQQYALSEEQALIAADAEPTDAYRALWLRLARTHAGKPDDQDFQRRASKIDHNAWPWSIVEYELGQVSEKEVWAAADNANSEDTKANQNCEAQFYIAENLLAHDRERAVSLLKLAADRCIKGFIEYQGAVFELRALEHEAPNMPTK
jgi:lipoprotein NlpI